MATSLIAAAPRGKGDGTGADDADDAESH